MIMLFITLKTTKHDNGFETSKHYKNNDVVLTSNQYKTLNVV